MAYSARVLADSLANGVRLTTLEVTLPRIVLAEFNTHRMLSRNSASSRAVPVDIMLQRVKEDPFVPIHWGKRQKGMQAEQELSARERDHAHEVWLYARDKAVQSAERMLDFGLHKQITNRLLEPWLWHTVIVTATEWDNFFALRCHPAAQPEMRRAAELLRDARAASTPVAISDEEWHLPLIDETDRSTVARDDFPWISAGRCARVSYLTHDGKRDPAADMALARSLRTNGHMSPFEHVARPLTFNDTVRFGDRHEPAPMCGNFRGWVQLRKTIPHESVFRPAAP